MQRNEFPTDQDIPLFLPNHFARIRNMKGFSKEQLARYDGKKGHPAHTTYNGKVYDVTASFLWKDGSHQVLHKAGADLTDALKQAPHCGVCLKFPVVGTLR